MSQILLIFGFFDCPATFALVTMNLSTLFDGEIGTNGRLIFELIEDWQIFFQSQSQLAGFPIPVQFHYQSIALAHILKDLFFFVLSVNFVWSNLEVCKRPFIKI